MPPFPKPDTDYAYDAQEEILKLRQWRDTKPGRQIPSRSGGTFLLGSWNIANLGDDQQTRDSGDMAILAEIISWFDVIAVQEVKEDLSDFRKIMQQLPQSYKAVFSDMAGNNERMTFIYDRARVQRLELAGEIAVPPSAHRYIKLPGIGQKFNGFDRNPFAVAFQIEDQVFTIVNAHLFYGTDSQLSKNRRALETYALGRWADLRAERGDAYSGNTVVIGDLNMPAARPGDEIYDALVKRGLHVPAHQSRIGTTITEGKHYDQMAFLPEDAGRLFVTDGVFDFDGAIFTQLWDQEGRQGFEAYMRYHISDHRPIWAQFRLA
ncbi:endonuclease/exonuclease/phosphatase family protein [uncultured Cohaesibacter sp.]|uniref:endonuclease/exonuclease/phosphatase family protein n=1 Tax=uncultured Cohaesibacter sp. TaxID=1002546 RepID=UPI0029C7125F|nr:endonuclease/exonuclease/phosphatase family protein [uncultured Cohaesibacter sp.]